MSGEIFDLIARHIKEHEKSVRVSPDKPLTFGERVNYGYGFEDGWRARESKGKCRWERLTHEDGRPGGWKRHCDGSETTSRAEDPESYCPGCGKEVEEMEDSK